MPPVSFDGPPASRPGPPMTSMAGGPMTSMPGGPMPSNAGPRPGGPDFGPG